MDDIGMALLELNAAAVRAVPFLRTELLERAVVANEAGQDTKPRRLRCRHQGMPQQPKKFALLAGVGVKIVEEEGLY